MSSLAAGRHLCRSGLPRCPQPPGAAQPHWCPVPGTRCSRRSCGHGLIPAVTLVHSPTTCVHPPASALSPGFDVCRLTPAAARRSPCPHLLFLPNTAVGVPPSPLRVHDVESPAGHLLLHSQVLSWCTRAGQNLDGDRGTSLWGKMPHRREDSNKTPSLLVLSLRPGPTRSHPQGPVSRGQHSQDGCSPGYQSQVFSHQAHVSLECTYRQDQMDGAALGAGAGGLWEDIFHE